MGKDITILLLCLGLVWAMLSHAAAGGSAATDRALRLAAEDRNIALMATIVTAPADTTPVSVSAHGAVLVVGVEFHGTDAEREDLLACLARQCTCTYAPNGARMTCCPGHTALIEDQGFVDHMVFMRRQRYLLIGQEFHPKKEKR